MAGHRYIQSSLFYDSDSWSKLITGGLLPFVKKYPNKQYLFVMNEEKGENIRFIVAVDESEFAATSHDFHTELSLFFEVNPSAISTPANEHSFFKNLPVNSICYNLFTHLPFIVEVGGVPLNLDNMLDEFWRKIIHIELNPLEEAMSNRFVFTLQLSFHFLFWISSNESQADETAGYMLEICLEKKANVSALLEEMEREFLPHQTDLINLASEIWEKQQSDEAASGIFFSFKSLFQKFMSPSMPSTSQKEKLGVAIQFWKKIIGDMSMQTEVIAYFVKRSL